MARGRAHLVVTAQSSRVCTRSLRVQIHCTYDCTLFRGCERNTRAQSPRVRRVTDRLFSGCSAHVNLAPCFFFHSAYPGPTRHHGSGMKCRQGNECHVSGPAVAGRTRVACRLQSLLYNAGGSASAPPRRSDNVLNPYPCPSVYHTLSAVWLV